MIEEEILVEHHADELGPGWGAGWVGRLLPLAFFGALILVWHLVTSVVGVSPLLLPSPADVLAAFREFSSALLEASRITLTEVGLGFLLAVISGVLLSVALAYSASLRPILYPLLTGLHSIPKVAIAPLFIIWFGFGLLPKVLIAFLVALFPIVVETTAGLRFVNPELHELAQTLSASKLRRFVRIDLPAALPYLFSGLKVGISLAVVGAVIGEFLTSDSGLGFILQSAASLQQGDLALAAAITVSFISVSLFGIVSLLEWWFLPWARRES